MSADDTRTVDPAQWIDAVVSAHDQGYVFFDWLSAVDRTYDEVNPGFDVVVRLLDTSEQGNLRGIRLTTRTMAERALPSLTGVFPGAAWHERETYEMFGVTFSDFEDGTGQGLRPLLLPEGFSGTPLRKSFVLAARASKAWPGGKEPGEGHGEAKAPGRRRVQAPGVPDLQWGPR
ncbi:MAG: NADH-quinone oxidoreductase subunit C [Nostocoides sp.]